MIDTPEQIEQKRKAIDAYTKRKLNVFLFTASYTLGMTALMGGIGYGLDRLLDTDPKLLIAGLIIAYPLTQYTLYKKLKANSPKDKNEHS